MIVVAALLTLAWLAWWFRKHGRHPVCSDCGGQGMLETDVVKSFEGLIVMLTLVACGSCDGTGQERDAG